MFLFHLVRGNLLPDGIQKIYVHGSCTESVAHIQALAQEVSKSLATKSWEGLLGKVHFIFVCYTFPYRFST